MFDRPGSFTGHGGRKTESARALLGNQTEYDGDGGGGGAMVVVVVVVVVGVNLAAWVGASAPASRPGCVEH